MHGDCSLCCAGLLTCARNTLGTETEAKVNSSFRTIFVIRCVLQELDVVDGGLQRNAVHVCSEKSGLE